MDSIHCLLLLIKIECTFFLAANEFLFNAAFNRTENIYFFLLVLFAIFSIHFGAFISINISENDFFLLILNIFLNKYVNSWQFFETNKILILLNNKSMVFFFSFHMCRGDAIGTQPYCRARLPIGMTFEHSNSFFAFFLLAFLF